MYAHESDQRLRKAGTTVSSIAYDPACLPDMGMGLGAPAVFRTSLVRFALRKLGMTMGQMPLSGVALAVLGQDASYEELSGSTITQRMAFYAKPDPRSHRMVQLPLLSFGMTPSS
jgi:hypothetical protein